MPYLAWKSAVERKKKDEEKKREEANLRTARDGRPFLDRRLEEPILLLFYTSIHKHNYHARTAAPTYSVLFERVQLELDEHLHDRKKVSMSCKIKRRLSFLSKFSKQHQLKASTNTLYLHRS